MKKSIVWIVSILLILSFALTGCGKTNEGSANTESNATMDNQANMDDGVADGPTASVGDNDEEAVNGNYNPAKDSDGNYIYTVFGVKLHCKTNIWDFIDEEEKSYDFGGFNEEMGCRQYVQGDYCFLHCAYAGNPNFSELTLDVVKVDPSTMVIDKSAQYQYAVKYDNNANPQYEYTIKNSSNAVRVTLDQVILTTYAVEHLMENLQDKPFGEYFTEYLNESSNGKNFTYRFP